MEVINTRTVEQRLKTLPAQYTEKQEIAAPETPTFDSPKKVVKRKMSAATYFTLQFAAAAVIAAALYLLRTFYPDTFDYVFTFVKAKFYVW